MGATVDFLKRLTFKTVNLPYVFRIVFDCFRVVFRSVSTHFEPFSHRFAWFSHRFLNFGVVVATSFSLSPSIVVDVAFAVAGVIVAVVIYSRLYGLSVEHCAMY